IDADRLVRVHVMRILSETDSWSASHRSLALAGLRDTDAFVQRAAADALGRHPALENVRPLLDLRLQVNTKASVPSPQPAVLPTAVKARAVTPDAVANARPASEPSADSELIYKVRQALRDQLRAPGLFAQLP